MNRLFPDLKRILSLVLTGALLSTSLPVSAGPGQVFKTPGGILIPLGAGGGTAGSFTAQQKGFISEMDFNLSKLGSLTVTPTLPTVDTLQPEVEPQLSPEEALLFLTGTAATAASQEDNESRQVLIEYMARPSIRDEVEQALLSGPAVAQGSRETVQKLRDVRQQLDSMPISERRLLVKGLYDLRQKLYTSTNKGATIAGTRKHLASLFDNGDDRAGSSAVPVSGAELSGRAPSGLLKPAGPLGEKQKVRRVPLIPGLPQDPQMIAQMLDEGNAQAVVQGMAIANQMHVNQPSFARLLLGFVRKAELGGFSEKGPSTNALFRHTQMTAFTELLQDLGKDTQTAADAALNIALTWISMRLTPIDDMDDLFSAMKSVVKSIGDSYSRFLDPDDFEKYMEEMDGKFGGIGIVLDLSGKGEGLGIGQVTPDGPSDLAGLEAGDRIIEIDGEAYQGLSDIERIKGKIGEPVNLTIRRGEGETAKTFKVDLVRAEITMPDPVWGAMIPGHDGAAYLKIDTFNELDVADQVRQTLKKLSKEGMKSLVIDVRYNPGGLLDKVSEIVSMFLKKGQTVGYMQKAGEVHPTRRPNSRDGRYADIPIVILANEYSASAAEFITSGLKDNDRAVFMGKQTYGKGIGQMGIPFELGPVMTLIYLTTFRWLTPLKKCIQGMQLETGFGGVKPDVELPLDKETEKIAGKNRGKTSYHPDEWDPAVDPWIMKAVENLESRP